MTLQERDYTLFLNDEEREAFELEEKIENRKGVKNHREFPRFSHPDESVRGHCFRTITCIYWNIKSLILMMKQINIMM